MRFGFICRCTLQAFEARWLLTLSRYGTWVVTMGRRRDLGGGGQVLVHRSLCRRYSPCQKYACHFTSGLSSLRCCCCSMVVAFENDFPLSEAWEHYRFLGGTCRLFSWAVCWHCSTFHSLVPICLELVSSPFIRALLGSIANLLVGQKAVFCLVWQKLHVHFVFTLWVPPRRVCWQSKCIDSAWRKEALQLFMARMEWGSIFSLLFCSEHLTRAGQQQQPLASLGNAWWVL